MNKKEEKEIMIKPIKDQFKYYFRLINYDKILKKKVRILDKLIKNRLKENKNLIKEIDRLDSMNFEKVAKIKSLKKEDDNKVIWLHTKRMYTGKWIPTPLKTIWKRIFHFDGYVLYGNKANDFKMMKIKNLSMIYNLVKKKESYNMVNHVGTFNYKPFFILKYPFAISLKILEKEQKLYYDPKAYYQYVNHATKLNLLSKEQNTGIGALIKKYWLFIMIIILIIIFISTPQGQKMLNDLITQMQSS